MKNIYCYELRLLFSKVKTYVFLALMILSGGIFTAYLNLYAGITNFEYTLEFVTFTLMALSPVLTFTVFSSDRKSGYDLMLSSLGIKNTSLVFGRFLATSTVFLIHYIILAANPIILSFFAVINVKTCVSALIGYLLTGLSLISLELFISSVSATPIISILISYAAMILLYLSANFRSNVSASAGISFITLTVIVALLTCAVTFSSKNSVFQITFASVFEVLLLILFFASPKTLSAVAYRTLSFISPSAQTDGFSFGLLKLESVITLICYIIVFLLLSLISQEKRRFN